jgi:hypothetical protein
MIVNLDKATFIVLSGSKVELFFDDTSSHMRTFKDRKELSEILDAWESQTLSLRGQHNNPEALTPALT